MLAPFTSFPSDVFCQSLAAEMNQSETAVVVRRADGPGYALRWFSPTTEVDLCGVFLQEPPNGGSLRSAGSASGPQTAGL